MKKDEGKPPTLSMPSSTLSGELVVVVLMVMVVVEEEATMWRKTLASRPLSQRLLWPYQVSWWWWWELSGEGEE